MRLESDLEPDIQSAAERTLAKKFASYLSDGLNELPASVVERLEVARMLALSATRKSGPELATLQT